MKTQDKERLTLTLDPYESALITRTLEISWPSGIFRRDKHRLIRLMIYSVCRALIRQRWKDHGPFSVEIKPESEQEIQERVKKIVPGQSGGNNWQIPNRWN